MRNNTITKSLFFFFLKKRAIFNKLRHMITIFFQILGPTSPADPDYY